MGSLARLLLSILVLAVVSTACNRDSTDASSTTLGEVTTTSLVAAGSGSVTSTSIVATTSSSTSTSTTLRAIPPEPEWSIVDRVQGDDGATVVVLLDPDSYERLTDIDLQNIVEDVIDMFPPIYEVHVVDSEDAAELVTADEPGPVGDAILAVHYFARLEEGFRLVFTGPFSDFGITVLGS